MDGWMLPAHWSSSRRLPEWRQRWRAVRGSSSPIGCKHTAGRYWPTGGWGSRLHSPPPKSQSRSWNKHVRYTSFTFSAHTLPFSLLLCTLRSCQKRTFLLVSLGDRVWETQDAGSVVPQKRQHVSVSPDNPSSLNALFTCLTDIWMSKIFQEQRSYLLVQNQKGRNLRQCLLACSNKLNHMLKIWGCFILWSSTLLAILTRLLKRFLFLFLFFIWGTLPRLDNIWLRLMLKCRSNRKLQTIDRAAAGILTNTKKRDHITPPLLHCI